MSKLLERHNDLRQQIKAYVDKEALTPDDASELEKLMTEAKAVDLQIQAAEYGVDPEPAPQANGSEDMKAMSEKLNELMQLMEDAPAIKNAGYYTVDGGSADPNAKSFGDFLMAVKRGDHKRLATIYGSQKVAVSDDGSTKALGEDAGSTGGYLIPAGFNAELLQIASEASPILSAVRRIPVAVPAGTWPALDQFVTPSAGAGDTALAAGFTVDVTAEGGALGTTEPAFEQITWRVYKEGNYVPVSNEVVADSPESIDALIRSVAAITVANKRERHIIRGTGAGEPLGVLTASAAIGITPATNNVFAYADALTMRSRFKRVGGKPMWVIHPGVWPDIGIFEVSAGSGGVFQANLAAALNQNILGWPINESEHSPQDDNAGNVILADFSAYLLFERGGLVIAFSEHAGFTNDQSYWRITDRFDGQPWLRSAITLADPQGSYTTSPFVYHND